MSDVYLKQSFGDLGYEGLGVYGCGYDQDKLDDCCEKNGGVGDVEFRVEEFCCEDNTEPGNNCEGTWEGHDFLWDWVFDSAGVGYHTVLDALC